MAYTRPLLSLRDSVQLRPQFVRLAPPLLVLINSRLHRRTVFHQPAVIPFVGVIDRLVAGVTDQAHPLNFYVHGFSLYIQWPTLAHSLFPDFVVPFVQGCRQPAQPPQFRRRDRPRPLIADAHEVRDQRTRPHVAAAQDVLGDPGP